MKILIAILSLLGTTADSWGASCTPKGVCAGLQFSYSGQENRWTVESADEWGELVVTTPMGGPYSGKHFDYMTDQELLEMRWSGKMSMNWRTLPQITDHVIAPAKAPVIKGEYVCKNIYGYVTISGKRDQQGVLETFVSDERVEFRGGRFYYSMGDENWVIAKSENGDALEIERFDGRHPLGYRGTCARSAAK